MDENDLNDFFDTAVWKDFGIIVTHIFTPHPGICRKFAEQSSKLMQSAGLAHMCRLYEKTLLIVLNFNGDEFNLSFFSKKLCAAFTKIVQETSFCVIYSELLSKKQMIMNELYFMLSKPYYALFLDRARPVPASWLHICEKAPVPNQLLDVNDILKLLREDSYQELTAVIDALSDYYPESYSIARPVSVSYINDQFTAIYYGIAVFFHEAGFKSAIFEESLTSLLLRSGGSNRLLFAFKEEITRYADIFNSGSNSNCTVHIKEIIDFTEKNIESVSLQALATHFNLSCEHISRLFKAQAGICFIEYVKSRKLEIAALTLRNSSDITIAQLCDKLGYQSRSHFQESFRQKYGISPGFYRRKHLSKASL